MTEAIVQSTEQSVLSIIERAAKDDSVDVGKMNALLDLQLRIMEKQSEASFNIAFAQASQKMPKIAKNGVIDMGTKGKMSYAKYEDLDAALRPIEQEFGFTRSFATAPNPNGVEMTIRLTHKDGHSVTSSRLMPPDTGAGRNAMQAIGSASSYAKRYLTMDIWNIVTMGADDDGAASGAVTDAQVKEIEALLEETNTDTAKFLAHFHAENIYSIQKRDFAEAVALLKQKARQRK